MMERQDEVIVNLRMALDQLYTGRINLAVSSIRNALKLIESQNIQAVDDEIVRLLEEK